MQIKPIIFVCAHNKQKLIQTNIIQAIHVGAVNSNVKLYNYQDDIGFDNISYKNKTYNELTGIYWAWKNLDNGFSHIGFFHYRRYLSFNINNKMNYFLENAKKTSISLHKLQNINIEKACLNNNIITITPTNISYILKKPYVTTVNDYIVANKKESTFVIIKNIITQYFPEYLESYNKNLTSKQMSFKNIFIMQKTLFNSYCEFLFGVLAHLEVELEKIENSSINKHRIYGFVAEYILDIFLIKTNQPVMYLSIIKPFKLQLNINFIKKQIYKAKKRLNLNYLKSIIYKIKNQYHT